MSVDPPVAPIGPEHCVIHSFEPARRVCHDCGHWYCDECLITPHGPRKPSYCVRCGIGRAGIRSGAGNTPIRSTREIRDIERTERQRAREAERRPVVVTPSGLHRALPAPAPAPMRPPAGGVVPLPVPGIEADPPRPRRRSLFRRSRPS